MCSRLELTFFSFPLVALSRSDEFRLKSVISSVNQRRIWNKREQKNE